MSADLGGSLVLPFDTDDPEFARGVECGRLWEQMEIAERCAEAGWESVFWIEQTIHGTNTEMVMRMCAAKGWGFEASMLDDDGYWIEVRLRNPRFEEAP